MITTNDAFDTIPWKDSTQVYVKFTREKSPTRVARNYDLTWDLTTVQKTFKSLCRTLVTIQRDVCVIEELSHILELLHDSVEKMKIECYRVGAISKGTNVKLPSSANISAKFSLQQIAVAIRGLSSLFNSLTHFGEKYKGESFNLMCYLNMNRISKAERLLQASHEKMQKLLKFSYVLRLQSIGLVFVCVSRWLRKIRGPRRTDDTLALEDGEDVIHRRNKAYSIDVGSPDESFREGLFTKTHEDKPPTLWPVSPISSLSLDISVNTSINSFVSNIPKTVFTPAILQSNSTVPKSKK